jgi:hypothetical protein
MQQRSRQEPAPNSLPAGFFHSPRESAGAGTTAEPSRQPACGRSLVAPRSASKLAAYENLRFDWEL